MVVADADMFIRICFLMSTCIMLGGIDVAMCPTADVHAEVRRAEPLPFGLLCVTPVEREHDDAQHWLS